jgi:hypothetical protein
MMPCGCCVHESDGMRCLRCKHSSPDQFEPAGKCATCKYDPRLHGVCVRCVDYDKHEPIAGIERPMKPQKEG